jgi:starvation-inducible DNA-binding protein
MDKLVEQLKITQATLMSFMVKAWGCHWNVTGPSFAEHHKFLGKVYTATISEIDTVSEHLRQCEAMAPAAFSKFMEATQITDTVVPMTAAEMFEQLRKDNDIVLGELEDTRDLADELGRFGIVSDIEALIAVHEKLAWKFRSFK